ncbi:hypothetical protein XAC40_p110001 [Xanthomonas citri pv. citri]|nr:hypothetical protein XAC40_p110001 [Xanthomonas citri pv. citri]
MPAERYAIKRKTACMIRRIILLFFLSYKYRNRTWTPPKTHVIASSPPLMRCMNRPAVRSFRPSMPCAKRPRPT